MRGSLWNAEFSTRIAETEWVLVSGGVRIQYRTLAGRFIEAESIVDVASYDGNVVVPR